MKSAPLNLVFVGGGHSHLESFLGLDFYTRSGHRVTVISPSDYHYYSAMGPGMLSGIYRPEEIRFNIRKMVEDRGANFMKDIAVSLNSEKRTLLTEKNGEVCYDFISFNIGSDVRPRGMRLSGENVFAVKPIVNLLHARNYLLALKERPLHVVVAGGGPAGIEVAANVWRLCRDRRIESRILILSRNAAFETLPARVRDWVADSLHQKNIELVEDAEVEALENGIAKCKEKGTYPFDIAFLATGVKPSSLFSESGLKVGKDGGMLVNSYLQSVSQNRIYGGGDCVSLEGNPLPKVGVYAVREGAILCHNLRAALTGGTQKNFTPQKHFMLVMNFGNGRGILSRNSFAVNGRTAFLLKNFIDRRFMRKFQVSGEQDEGKKTGG